MKYKFYLIHGLFDKTAGKRNVETLIPELKRQFPDAEFEIDECDYGWMGAFKASWFYWTTDIIPRISKALEHEEGIQKIVIAHSNGCNFTMKALSKIINPHIRLFFLSPALNAKYKFKEYFKKCNVFYSSTDSIVWLAKLLIGSRLGAMGRYGAKSNDCRVHSKNLHDIGIRDHSDYFLKWKHKKIVDRIRNEL